MHIGDIKEGCESNYLDETNSQIIYGITILSGYNNSIINLILFLLTILFLVSVAYWWRNREQFCEEEDKFGYILLNT